MSVYKRGTSWYINIQVNGERIHRKAGDTEKEARELQDTLRREARKVRLRLKVRGRISFEQAALEFLRHTKDTLSPRTYTLYNDDYKNHVAEFFKLFYLVDIQNDTLLTFQARQKKKKLGNRTVNIHISLIRKIINYAVQKGYIHDPGLKYPMLRESKRLHAFLSPEEFESLIKNVSYDLAMKRFQIGRLTGMRPKELAYLAWTDIDYEYQCIKVQAKPKDGFAIKTDEERLIPLSKEAIGILQGIPRISRWVFSNNKNPVLDVRRALKTAARNAGVSKTVTPGMLRHTFATHSLKAGADIQAVQKIMGHKSLQTTYGYTHAIQESMKEAVELLTNKKSPHSHTRPPHTKKGRTLDKTGRGEQI